MPEFNLHTHTARCRHAVGTDEEMVQAAIQAGLNVLGFSDHIPLACLQNVRDRMNLDESPEYLQSVSELKQKYQGQIKIVSGYEFEYFPQLLDELWTRRREVDYMILGNHYLSPGGIDFCEAAEDDQVLLYAERVVQAMKSGLADCVAHPDYFMLGRDCWSEACEAASFKICEAAAETGIPLEINLNGIRYGVRSYKEGWRYAYPWARFWQIAAQFRCSVIYGMDAHAPEQLLLMDERIEQVKTWIDLTGLHLIESWDEILLKRGQEK